jgi:hypothetical protein
LISRYSSGKKPEKGSCGSWVFSAAWPDHFAARKFSRWAYHWLWHRGRGATKDHLEENTADDSADADGCSMRETMLLVSLAYAKAIARIVGALAPCPPSLEALVRGWRDLEVASGSATALLHDLATVVANCRSHAGCKDLFLRSIA